MPPEWRQYLRLRSAAVRRRRCRELFDWDDEAYGRASARFCDWALAFADAEQEAAVKRAKQEADRRAREMSGGGGRG